MKHTIKLNSEGLTIEVFDIAGKEEQLLDEFQACKDGRCDCPTEEYGKLDTLEIHDSAGKIGLQLKAKSGRVLDESEIEKCLDHTKRKLDEND